MLGLGPRLAQVQLACVEGGEGEVDITSQGAVRAVAPLVHCPWDEVAGDGNDEGVGDHCQLGEGPHDVLPDSDIPGVLGNRAPVTPQQLFGIQSANIVVTGKWQAQ